MNIPRSLSGAAIALVASLAVAVSLFPGAKAFSTPTVQFSLSAPNVVESSVTGDDTLTEDFEYADLELPGSSPLGTYRTPNSVSIRQDEVWGGSGSQFLSIGARGSFTIELNEPARYIGFWWGSGDRGNSVELFGGDPEIRLATFSTATLMDLLLEPTVVDIDGNTQQSSQYKRTAAAGQPFGYVNLQLSDENIAFSKVVFKQGATPAFELDNVTVSPTWGQATFATREPAGNDEESGGDSDGDEQAGGDSDSDEQAGGDSDSDEQASGGSNRKPGSVQEARVQREEQPSLATTGVSAAQKSLLFASLLLAAGVFLRLASKRTAVSSIDGV